MNPSSSTEHARLWLDPQLGNLELLQATYTTFAFTPHAHDTYAIGVTERGAQAYSSSREKKLLMPTGSVAVVHPGEMHTSQAADENGWSYRMFYPRAEYLQQVASELAGHACDLPVFPSPVIHDAELAWHVRSFHVAEADPAVPALERQSKFLFLLGFLIRRHADGRSALCKAGREPAYVRRVCRYLDEHYAESVLLEQVAEYVGLSPFHLLRVFRSSTGLTPHAYLTHVRIERSKQLLRQGVALADVAAETGFSDQSHFSKYFKRTVGIPPGQYR